MSLMSANVRVRFENVIHVVNIHQVKRPKITWAKVKSEENCERKVCGTQFIVIYIRDKEQRVLHISVEKLNQTLFSDYYKTPSVMARTNLRNML